MKNLAARRRLMVSAVVCALLCTFGAAHGHGQAPTQRVFEVSKPAVQEVLKQLQPATSGRLPVLEGFAVAGAHPLSRYQRGFYQCSVRVTATSSGQSEITISAKITAWYADPDSTHSGYELLRSNGRIEADLLDQIAEQLSSHGAGEQRKSPIGATTAKQQTATEQEATISAPVPRAQDSSASFKTDRDPLAVARPMEGTALRKEGGVQSEIATLEDLVKNQAHPKNLVAVKKSGTPVVGSPSLSGKVLFAASAHDEFEMLDYNADWVHVRVSGLSRGWIWRTSLEMPEGIPDVPRTVATGPTTAADLFQVSREETASFPGDWEPLRGKNVKIISVQKVRENEQGGGPSDKLEFAKSLLDKNYEGLAKSPELSGLVLIFDSADGGMIAATFPTIQRWKAGGLSDAALWHQCYFDPPETFTLSSGGGGN
jgi:hypothetical protein